jgi:putative SOS response-associated peptidase YedK
MCGRFTLFASPDELSAYFRIESSGNIAPRYNICPSQTVPCIIQDDKGKRIIKFFRWGLIPSWADDPTIGNRLINARSETVATKPSFRSAFKYRRCLIPSNGFFEWKRIEKRKCPYFIRMSNGEPFAFAGIWEHWTDPDGKAVETCTILTTTCNDLVGDIHNRMPVILNPEDYDLWLNPEAPEDALKTLMKPFPAEFMDVHEVTDLINNPRYDAPDCTIAVHSSQDT